MQRSSYLASALDGMAQNPGQPQGGAMDLAQMKAQSEAARAWKAANPEKSRIAHGVQQMGAGLKAAPGRLMATAGDLAHMLGRLG